MAGAERSREVQSDGLSSTQETALSALRAGETFVRAAERAGVSRVTVYRWVRGDPQFQAAYNAWQQEVTESARARLTKLADKAVDVVEHALEKGDEKVALKVLRGVGVLRKRRGASIDPKVLGMQIKLRDEGQVGRVEKQMLTHLLKKMGMPVRRRKRIMDGRDTVTFAREVRETLEERGAAEEGQGQADVTPQQTTTEAAGGTPGRPEEDNPLNGHGMRMGMGGHDQAAGDVTLDVTSEGTLHESVA